MKKSIRKFVMALFVVPCLALSANAQGFDWPQWRGPDRDGVCKETGLMKSWPKEGPAVAWKAADIGGGYSTPSVAKGKVFGMSYQGENETVWALDEKNGKKLWETNIGQKGKVGYNEGSRCTPTVDGDSLYVVGVSGDIAALNINTGKVLWAKNFAKDFKGKMMSGWGFSESPLVDGDKVLFTPGGDQSAMIALNKKTGATIWSTKVENGGGAGYASIVKSKAGGVDQYITWLGKCIIGVDAKSGNLLWRYSANANGTANIPTPIVKDDYVFSSTGYGSGTSLIKLNKSSSGFEAKEVFYLNGKKTDIQNHHGGMLLLGDKVYMGTGHNNGIPCCLDMMTGDVVWKEEKRPGTGSAAIVYADGMLYFRNQDGTMNLLEASPKGYKLVSSFKLPDASGKPSWPHPVIANGRLLIRDQGKLIAFSIKQAQ